eukprot:gene725-1814_t
MGDAAAARVTQAGLEVALVPCLSDNYCPVLHDPRPGGATLIRARAAAAAGKGAAGDGSDSGSESSSTDSRSTPRFLREDSSGDDTSSDDSSDVPEP